VQGVAAALRSGEELPDHWFDRHLPRDLRAVSNQHWTPLVVTKRVAKWIAEFGIRTVVDIGSGAGKFCVATALATDCHFTGIEQRPRLVGAARSLARVFGVEDRVEIVEGVLGECEIPGSDAYYLYNPFGENIFPRSDDHLDDDVELSEHRYARDVATMERFFQAMPLGTHVIKYNGFGGQMPRGYRKIRAASEMPNLLRLWRKVG
jgi:predicted RNA methylase